MNGQFRCWLAECAGVPERMRRYEEAIGRLRGRLVVGRKPTRDEANERRLFVDTGILVHHLDTEDPRKHRIAERLVGTALVSRDACIGHQVVQACLNVVLHEARLALTTEQARLHLDTVLQPLWRVMPGAALVHRTLDFQSRWRFSLLDSQIVAAALAAGCTRLHSEQTCSTASASTR